MQQKLCLPLDGFFNSTNPHKKKKSNKAESDVKRPIFKISHE